jgi:methionyl-tRNA formyltransferase
MAALKLAFMGAADFAVPALDALAASDHRIAAVYTQPPRPAGRGRKERRTPVHDRAADLGLDVLTPLSLKDADEQARFAAFGLDAAVVVAYGLLLPAPILNAPRLGCLNIHPSLLPRWRGAAPVARAILAGDTETGVSIIVVDEGLDTGPILAQTTVPMPARATTGTFEPELAALGAGMLLEALAGYDAGAIEPRPQGEAGATYAHKFSKEDGRIDWTASPEEIDRQVRAMSPWPSAWFTLDEAAVRVLACEPAEGEGAPGTLLPGRDFAVACGTGALRLDRVQRAGKAAMSGADFLRGARLEAGTRLA